ncbi:MAG TPA: FAD-dependent monooxygenase [Solirubrobacteraceae bacterium]|jgi:3-(3-hydroxy-phenyl)propionate hydroxylase|nr:FAD-dependent monooxygenase [Solirubrobacteraceae bacterium]
MRAPPGACDVLVVGLGPVGLLLTALLRAQGRDVVAVERDPAVAGEPRAAVLDDEALRALQAAGAAGAVVAAGVVLERAELELRDGRSVTLMHAPARTANGHPALVGIHQPALARRLEQAAGASAFRGLELTGLRDGGDVVSATLLHVSGARHAVRARWVVGCDGAHSAVRRLAGIGFGGTTFSQRWLVVDAAVARTGPRRATFTGDPAAPAVTLPLTPGIRRWEVMVEAGAEPDPDALVHARAPHGAAEATAIRSAAYTFHARVADRWRAGRVLLAGDAAHVMPPFAGQGLGSGLRDAVNLAWKLGAVLDGRCPAELLDTYEAERRPHVMRLTALARLVGAIVQTRRPRVASARDRVLLALDRTAIGARLQAGGAKPAATLRGGALAGRTPGAGALLPQPAVRTGKGALVALDDALGPGWALLAREPQAPFGAARVVVLGRDVEDRTGVLDRWLARHGAAVALVRPDRHVAATAPRARDAAAALSRYAALV